MGESDNFCLVMCVVIRGEFWVYIVNNERDIGDLSCCYPDGLTGDRRGIKKRIAIVTQFIIIITY